MGLKALKYKNNKLIINEQNCHNFKLPPQKHNCLFFTNTQNTHLF